jgi:hypothetical protein
MTFPAPTGAPGDTFAFSFQPESLLRGMEGDTNVSPFYYGFGSSTEDYVTLLDSLPASGSDGIFPNIQFGSMASARIVGASIIVTQTQKIIDRAGYGVTSRIYGLPVRASNEPSPNEPDVRGVSKTTVINAIYKDEANFSDGEGTEMRMVYAPGDFTDLHMRLFVGDKIHKQPDLETLPVIQGFITGYGITNQISITIEFNVVFEYVPKPVLYQMTERKPAKVDPRELARGENAVGNTNAPKVTTGLLNEVKGLQSMGANAVRALVRAQPRQAQGGFMNF